MSRPVTIALLVVAGIAAAILGYTTLVRPTDPARPSPATVEPGQLPAATTPPHSPASSRPQPIPAAAQPASDTRPAPATTPPTPTPSIRSHPLFHDYLPGYTPSEIKPDGTHVYRNYPFQVKQPDGTMATVPVTVELAPTAPKPQLPAELEGGK